MNAAEKVASELKNDPDRFTSERGVCLEAVCIHFGGRRAPLEINPDATHKVAEVWKFRDGSAIEIVENEQTGFAFWRIR